MRWTVWSTVAALLLALVRDASAQPSGAPRVHFPGPLVDVYARLTYERKPGARVCPGDDFLRRELARHMGYDPFTPNAEGIAVGDVHIIIAPDPDGFAVRYDWTGPPDVHEASQRFTRESCRDAVVDIAVVLRSFLMLYSMRYGERYAPKRKPPACLLPALAEQTPPACPESRFAGWPTERPIAPLEEPKPSPPKSMERWPSALRFGVTAGVESVASGWGSLGLAVEAGARYRFISLDFEAHGDPSLQAIMFPGHGAVSFARVSGALLLCGHVGWLAACGVLDEGRIIFPNHLAALPPSTPYTAAGARAALEIPAVPPLLFVRTMVDLRATIRPASYVDSTGTPTYFAPAAPGFAFGGGLLLELPP